MKYILDFILFAGVFTLNAYVLSKNFNVPLETAFDIIIVSGLFTFLYFFLNKVIIKK